MRVSYEVLRQLNFITIEGQVMCDLILCGKKKIENVSSYWRPNFKCAYSTIWRTLKEMEAKKLIIIKKLSENHTEIYINTHHENFELLVNDIKKAGVDF